MSMPRVIVSGAGIAGTVLAYWLGKKGFQVVVLERSAAENQSGQIIDVEGPAQEIVKRMGVMDEIQSKTTHEAGIRFVDESGREVATFPAGKTGISNDIEIMRPALTGILLAAADSFPNVEFRYGRTIQSLQQTDSKVIVDIQERGKDTISKEEFDILIACDGLRSATRDMILPIDQRKSCLQSINAFAAFFSIPAQPQDRPYCNFYGAPGRRSVGTKPWTEKETSAYLTYCKFDQKLRDARESRDVKLQKETVAGIFQGLGWETDRLVKGMMEAQNFYFEELSQVMVDKWSQGRCVLVGDTAYCPSPITGQGTNLAILGAYVLASKIVADAENPTKAFEEYEKDMRPYVNKVQPIPLGGYLPLLANPDTNWGVWINRNILSWISWLQPWKYFPDLKNVPYALPDI
ncbi:MAG: hypothetical protein M1837_003541 [Sclerophora amabilis]|nr:MAG: hypothetical protein M1837_003541 [Sclerophora amabilis]